MSTVHGICCQLVAIYTCDCLGCAVLLCLVCLFDLACFFLSSHLSFKNMYGLLIFFFFG